MRLTRQGLLAAILVVAALFVGSTVSKWIPTADDVFANPFLHHGAMGDAVELRTGRVTVTGIRSATELTYLGQTAVTTALWLVVDLNWIAKDEPAWLSLTSVRLETVDGVRYGGLPALSPTCGPSQPGLPLHCQIQFEVPADALEGAVVLFPASTSTSGGDDVAAINLGITAADAARLAAPTAPLELDGETAA